MASLPQLPYDFVGAPQAGQTRAPQNIGGLLGGSMLGAAGLPSLTGGGSSAASANYGQTRFGNVSVNGGSGGMWLWIFLLGTVGAVVWYKVKTK